MSSFLPSFASRRLIDRLHCMATSSLLLSIGCTGVGECEVFPARCAPRVVGLQPSLLPFNAGSSLLLASFEPPWAQSQQLWGQLLNSDGVVRATLVRRKAGSPVQVMLDPVNDLLLPGTYSLRLGYGQDPRLSPEAAAPFRYELTQAGRPPTLEVQVPVPTLTWRAEPSSPLSFIPKDPTAPVPNLSLRGLWLGRGGSDLAATEVLLMQGYTNFSSYPLAAIRRSTMTNPAMSWIEDSVGSKSLFSVWGFGSSVELQNPRVILWNETVPRQYKVNYGVLTNPESAFDMRGQTLGFEAIAMAIAIRTGSSTFGVLVQNDIDLRSYISTRPGELLVNEVRGIPWQFSPLTRMTPYAAKSDGTGLVGVIGMTAGGEPALFSWDGFAFSYDPLSDEIRQPNQLGTVTTDALAVGDVDGNGFNDIVVARGGKVKFFLQLAGRFVPASTEVTLPADVSIGALAVGQLDGQGKLDLAVADAKPRKCAVSDCNQVFVYLNQTQ